MLIPWQTILQTLQEDRVCLNSFTGAASIPLKETLGKYLELECLIEVGNFSQIRFINFCSPPVYPRCLESRYNVGTRSQRLQHDGLDLFPERDAASYLKGLPIKHPITERHLRECMALLSTSYVFSWSRWNASRSFREIVLQFKEVHGCVAKEVM